MTWLMVNYLCKDMDLKTIQAYVMPENVYSLRALLKNGFIENSKVVQGKNWGGKDSVELREFTYTVE